MAIFTRWTFIRCLAIPALLSAASLLSSQTTVQPATPPTAMSSPTPSAASTDATSAKDVLQMPDIADIDPNSFVLKTTVNRVLVDVTVTDKQGNPVTNLTQDDFKVEEDKRTQRVLSFDKHDFDGPMEYVPPSLPPRPANTFIDLPSAPERGPLYVLFYDVANIPRDDQMFARAQMTKFIKEKPEGARFAVVIGSGGVHLIQGFTSDKAELLAAIDPKDGHPRMKNLELMGRNLGGEDKLSAVANLNSLAHYLAKFPGKKNLLWLASGFPISMTPVLSDTTIYEVELKRAIDLLAQERIAVFPVDTRGVVVYNEKQVDGGGNPGASAIMTDYDAQDQLALMTGGKAFHSNNDMKGVLATATRLGGSYYTLSYSPTNKNYNGRLREIRVTLNKDGYQLSYRHGYFGTDTSTPLPIGEGRKLAKSAEPILTVPGPEDVSLSTTMEHGAPALHELIFGAKVRVLGPPAMATQDQMARLMTEDAFRKVSVQTKATKSIHPVKLQPYVVDYTITEHQFRMDGPRPEIQIAVAAYDLDGNLLNARASIETEAAAENPAVPKTSYKMEQRIDVPQGARFLRIAVRDPRTDRAGAMEIPLPLAPDNQVAQVPAGRP